MAGSPWLPYEAARAGTHRTPPAAPRTLRAAPRRPRVIVRQVGGDPATLAKLLRWAGLDAVRPVDSLIELGAALHRGGDLVLLVVNGAGDGGGARPDFRTMLGELRDVRAVSPVPVVIGVRDPSVDLAIVALEHGARGVVDLAAPPALVVRGMLAVWTTGSFVPRPLQAAVVRRMAQRRVEFTRDSERTARLTAREREILDLLAAGAHRADLAAQLSMSPHTVRTHIDRLKAKLGVSTQRQAVALWLRIGEEDLGDDGQPNGPDPQARDDAHRPEGRRADRHGG